MDSRNNFNKDHIEALELMYSELVQPSKLIEYFESDAEFKEWAELGTSEDIRAALIAFEKDELYDHCTILKQVLLEKINEERLG
jgi:hypothetical protein